MSALITIVKKICLPILGVSFPLTCGFLVFNASFSDEGGGYMETNQSEDGEIDLSELEAKKKKEEEEDRVEEEKEEKKKENQKKKPTKQTPPVNVGDLLGALVADSSNKSPPVSSKPLPIKVTGVPKDKNTINPLATTVESVDEIEQTLKSSPTQTEVPKQNPAPAQVPVNIVEPDHTNIQKPESKQPNQAETQTEDQKQVVQKVTPQKQDSDNSGVDSSNPDGAIKVDGAKPKQENKSTLTDVDTTIASPATPAGNPEPKTARIDNKEDGRQISNPGVVAPEKNTEPSDTDEQQPKSNTAKQSGSQALSTITKPGSSDTSAESSSTPQTTEGSKDSKDSKTQTADQTRADGTKNPPTGGSSNPSDTAGVDTTPAATILNDDSSSNSSAGNSQPLTISVSTIAGIVEELSKYKDSVSDETQKSKVKQLIQTYNSLQSRLPTTAQP